MSSALDCIDWFCGMGGSSSGLVEAGIEIKVAANHWERAIETHAANHPDTDHLCADIQAIDLRRLPKTRLMWASPICTEVSPAGGRKRRHQADLFEKHGHVASAAFERTRVTFWEVIRAAELFRHDVIMIENVVEAVTTWELFDTWLAGMRVLGYTPHFVSVSAAHVWDAVNAPAPQWRDRIYIVLTRKGIKAPDLDPRPLAWCEQCAEVVPAMQWWKPHGIPEGYRVGKYNQQYHYVCPEGHGRIEPCVAPAAAAIDWTDLGTRIGDRKRPLADKTMARIRYGAQLVQSEPWVMGGAGAQLPTAIDDPLRTQRASGADFLVGSYLVGAAGNTWDAISAGKGGYVRAWPASDPLQTQAATAQLGLVVPTGGTWNTQPTGTTEPLRTMLTRDAYGIALSGKFVMAVNHDGHGRHFDPDAQPLPAETAKRGEALVMDEAFVTMLRANGRARPATGDALPTFSTGRNHMLVVPFRKGDRAHYAAAEPITTTATKSQHGLMVGAPELDVDDYHFRMLKPREAANAQRFARDYTIHGNQGEQQVQAGNAVAVNVAHWIGKQVAAALDGRAA